MDQVQTMPQIINHRVSIITPSYQQGRFIDACIGSVSSQDHDYKEQVIVDGGSTDRTKAILEHRSDQLHWWCSEPDRGQSHAINKGLAHATGTIFNWLNSDDELLPGALTQVAKAFANDPELIIYGGARTVRHMDGTEEVRPIDNTSNPITLFTKPLTNQQSTFIRMDVVKEIGGVDEQLKFVMDYELWLQVLFRYGTEHVRIEPIPLALFRMHEASKTGTQQPQFVDEMAGVLHGLCERAGLKDLGEMLARIYTWPHGLRGIPVRADQKELVSHMSVCFLIERNRVIHNEAQFVTLRQLIASDYAQASWLDAEQRTRIKVITEQVSMPSWFAFRAKRKWHHLWQ